MYIKNGIMIVLFSGELDKVVVVMIIVNGVKVVGRDVIIFCIFWGLNVFKKI